MNNNNNGRNMKKTLSAVAAVTLALGGAVAAAPTAHAVTNSDTRAAKAAFRSIDSFDNDADYTTYRYKRLLPLQKKACKWEGFYTASTKTLREIVDEEGIEFGSDVGWSATKTKKVKTAKIWNGKKYVTVKNSVKVYFRVGYRFTWDDDGTVYKDPGTIHVFNHKYFALNKGTLEKCEKASR